MQEQDEGRIEFGRFATAAAEGHSLSKNQEWKFFGVLTVNKMCEMKEWMIERRLLNITAAK